MSSEKVHIFDTTLRDGEQVPGCQLRTEEKVIIAKELEQLGVDIIEAGFPISSPGDFTSVVEISKAVSEPVICALTRAVEKDIEVAADSLKYAKRKRIHTGIGASDYHIKHKFNSTREKILERGVAAVKYAKKFVEDVEFYAEDAGRADLEFLSEMIEKAIAAGATVVNIPDTTGYCLPEDYGAKIKYLKEHVKNIDQAIISCHCHNDLGLATANTMAGVRNGARQVEVTINGIGERAGNTSLEEVAMIIRTHQDLDLHTGIYSPKIYPVSLLVSRMMRMAVQPNKAIVGRNAFAHSSGIHQDGFLKNKINYEIIDPEDVGVGNSSIVLTARSGRAALRYRLQALGFSVDKEQMDGLYEKFLEVADDKKGVDDEDLMQLAGGTARNRTFEMKNLKVSAGTGGCPKAELVATYKGKEYVESAEGKGPIDATLRSINQIIEKEIKLEDFLVEAFRGGSDDTGKVQLQVSYDRKVYYGIGSNPDIVLASAHAYIDAINKFL